MKLSALSAIIVYLAGASAFAGTVVENDPSNSVLIPGRTEQNLGFTLGLGYDSDYVFRGREIASNNLSSSLDYSHALSDYFSFKLGTAYRNTPDDKRFSDLETSVGLNANLGLVEIGAGYRWYHVFEVPKGTAGKIINNDINETCLTLSSGIGPADLTVAVFYDAHTHGFYYDFSVSTEYKINDRISLVPGISTGLNSDYYSVSGFSHMKPSLTAPIKLSKNIILTPYVAGNIVFDNLKAIGEKNRVYGGLSLAVNF